MAKLFKTSILLLLAAFLLIAEATHHDDHKKKFHKHDDDSDDHDDHEDGLVGAAALDKLKGLVPKFKIGSKTDGSNSGTGSGSDSGAEGGCKCSDAKFREFLKKFITIYRAYASKELAPEIKSMLSKLVDFTMGYLAKEKPNEVNKVHSFLQNTAKVTGSVVGQA